MLHNKFRRITVAALAATVFAGINVFAAQPENVGVIFDAETGIVTINGTHPGGEGSIVTVRITADGNVFYQRELLAQEQGSFSVKCTMDSGSAEMLGDTSTLYNVKIGGIGIEPVETSYRFINEKDGEGIVKEANEAQSAEAMEAVINTYATALGVELGEDSDFYKITDKKAVFEALADAEDYDLAMKVATAFNNAVAVQILNEASDDNAAELVDKYGEMLGLDMGKESRFTDIKTEEKKLQVYENMTGAKLPLNDLAKVRNHFKEGVYLALFDEVSMSNVDMLMTYIEECNEANYMDVSLDDYESKKLSDVDRVEILKAFLKDKSSDGFESLSDVEELFEKIAEEKLEDVEKEDKKKGSGGGGGGGGGGATVTTKLPATTVQKPAVTPAPIVEEDKEAVVNTTFTDLENTAWAVEAIENMALRGIVNGVGDNKFMPDKQITREEFVKMLMLALNIPSEETEKTFTDVKEDAWYYDCVMDAYATNIVKGIDFDVFGVGTSITREQMCTMIYRAMNFMDIYIDDTENTMNFADADEISEYAKDAVEALFRGGVVNGVSNTEFAPKGYATRAMATQMLYNLLERGNID